MMFLLWLGVGFHGFGLGFGWASAFSILHCNLCDGHCLQLLQYGA